MRGADVCARRHHGDVGGERQDEAGRCRASAGGSDEHDDRCARRESSGVTMSRVESSSPPGVRSTMTTTSAPAASALIDHAGQVFGGDRVDDAIELGDDARAGDEWASAPLGTAPREDQSREQYSPHD